MRGVRWRQRSYAASSWSGTMWRCSRRFGSCAATLEGVRPVPRPMWRCVRGLRRTVRRLLRTVRRLHCTPSPASPPAQQPESDMGSAAEGAARAESRYKKLYRDSMDPFAAFSARERRARVGELGVVERMVLRTSRACLSSAPARLLAFVYACLLHALVFAMIFHFAHTDHGLCAHGDGMSVPGVHVRSSSIASVSHAV